MTIPSTPPLPTTKYTTSEKNPINIKKEENKFLPETEQPYFRKSITKFKKIEKYQSASKSLAASFIAHLPDDLQLELGTIKIYCIYNEKLVEILNGHGVLYNRLIILLNKIDYIMTQNDFSDKQKIEVEETLNLLLTGGQLDLVNDIGRVLNHIEESYHSGKWSPGAEDRHLFDQDHENRDAQNYSGDFYPKWMKETAIVPGIPVSAATLAYWNFRHSQKNDDRWQLSDTLIKDKDPGLFHWIHKLRELKAAFHTPDIAAPSSPSSLTGFHIEAIAARLDYADKIANEYFKSYNWNDPGPCTQKRRKQKNKQPFHQASGWSAKRRRHNPKYQKSAADDKVVISPAKRNRKNTSLYSTADNGFSRMDKENLLKETGIPELEKIIKSVLEEEEQKSVPVTTLEDFGEESYHIKRAEIIEAQDELSRLYDACRHHCGIGKSSSKGSNIEKSVSIKSEQRKNKKNSLDKKDIPEPNKPPYNDKSTTNNMSISDRKPDFSEAQNAFINLIEKSRELSLQPAVEPEKLRSHLEDFGYAPAWQPLSTVLKLPMPFLKKLFKIEGKKNPESIIKIKERVPKLVQDTKKIISIYRYNSTVWCPDIARETLNPVIQKVREVQLCFSEIIAFQRKQEDLFKSSHHTKEDIKRNEEQLKNTQEALAKTAIVLTSLEDFSAYLKSEKHQELYERLLKAMAEWNSCIANTSESLFPAPPVRIS